MSWYLIDGVSTTPVGSIFFMSVLDQTTMFIVSFNKNLNGWRICKLQQNGFFEETLDLGKFREDVFYSTPPSEIINKGGVYIFLGNEKRKEGRKA